MLTSPTDRLGGLFVVPDATYAKRRAAGYSDTEARAYPERVRYYDRFYVDGIFYPNLRLLARGCDVSETSLRRLIREGQSPMTALARLRYTYPPPDADSPLVTRRIRAGFTRDEAMTFPLGIRCESPVRVYGVTFPSENAFQDALCGTSRAFRKACRALRKTAPSAPSRACLFFDADQWHACVPIRTEQII